jgi:hypothetical protein
MPPRPRSMISFASAAPMLGGTEAELVELAGRNLLRGEIRLDSEGWWMTADTARGLADGGLKKAREIMARRKIEEAA